MAAPAANSATLPPGSSISAAGADQTLALKALKAMDFESVTHRNDVWLDGPYDVPDLHEDLRAEFDEALEDLVQSKSGRSPLGWFITGSGGRGKTHLLSAFRRSAIAHKAAFVLVDLTDVRSFWDTVLQGMVSSLQQPYDSGRYQYQTLLQNAVSRFKHALPPQRIVEYLQGRKTTDLAGDMKGVLASFAKHPGAKIPPLRHRDVIRSLVCLNSNDPTIAGVGLSWLQGLELEEEERKSLDFQAASAPSREIAEALSWLMGFAGPTVLAFDQLDPIVTQAERGASGPDDESGVTMGIVRDIGDGLGALYTIFDRTLPVVVCVEQTLETLRRHALTTALDRFNPPQPLPAIADGRIAAAVVRCRTAPAFEKSGFAPPHDVWPIAPELFDKMANLTPREVLKICQAHRLKCLRAKRAEVLTSLAPPGPGPEPVVGPVSANPQPTAKLDAKFAAYQKDADPKSLLEEKEEDSRLAPLLKAALWCLVQEAELPADVAASLDAEFTGGKKTKPLHARLRLIFHSEFDREEHFSTRALQYLHPRAYLTRLKDAMTGAGIDKHLRFRRLVVVRTNPQPSGEECTKLRQSFVKQGGIFYELPEAELRMLFALQKLREENDAGFLDWLRARRPASGMRLLQVLAPHPLLGTAEKSPPTELPPPKPDAQPAPRPTPAATAETVATTKIDTPRDPLQPTPAKAKATSTSPTATAGPARPPSVTPPIGSGPSPEPVKATPVQPVPPENAEKPTRPHTGFIPFGKKVVGVLAQGEWKLPIGELARHMVVLAGAGSGKTVLLRRVVEEAVLEGIPSIVVDCGQDLSTLGEAWPPKVANFVGDDAFKADIYLQSSDVVIWTPGKPSGNPMFLELLPDLPAMADAPEELGEAVDMVVDSLMPIVGARGSGRAADHKKALLRSVLRFYARHEGGGLEALTAILRALPEEAGLGIDKEEKYAREMADSLAAAKETNPLLRNAGTPLDPAVLFGDDAQSPSGRTRVSVLSLVGLPGQEAQQTFVNQLAMTLFAWIKRNPLPPGRPLRGLLVIDEARDFAPSQRACPSRESLVRLVAQARKYRLGVVFATQNPKDLDNKIVSNCSTHCYGKVGSPVAIEAAKELIASKGGNGDDVARLPKGVFYAHNADSGQGGPMKIKTPLCLSHHRASPPSPEEIVAMAAASRRTLTGG